MKNLLILTGDRGRKPTDFLEEGLSLFRFFISAIFDWRTLLLFGGPGGLDGGPSHGRSGVNQGRDRCWLGEVLLMELAKKLSKMLHHQG